MSAFVRLKTLATLCTGSCILTGALIAGQAHADGEEEGDPSPHIIIAKNGSQLVTAFEGSDGTVIVTEDLGIGGLSSTQFGVFPFELAFEAPGVDEVNELIGLGELPVGSVPLGTSDFVELIVESIPDDFRVDGDGATLIDGPTSDPFISLGAGGLDEHVIWTFLSPSSESTTAQFRISGTGFSSSDPFSVTLAVPEPTSLVLFGLAAPALMLRRRHG
ncbi:MAG: PEP-CTERM sorting domain-containing protein [Planctomycetota bacterium]